MVEILELVHEISSFPEVLHKRDALKNFSKHSDKHKKQSSGAILSKDILKNFGRFTEKTSLPESLFSQSCSHPEVYCQNPILKRYFF